MANGVIIPNILYNIYLYRIYFLPFMCFWSKFCNFPGHPWLLFYTEQTLERLTFKPKTRNRVRLTSHQLTDIHDVESERNKIIGSNFLSDDSSLSSSSDSLSRRSEEQECGLVDALGVAISRVRISEPKRSRLCSPSSPIRQECSSEMKVNNLCTAFWVGWIACRYSHCWWIRIHTNWLPKLLAIWTSNCWVSQSATSTDSGVNLK